MKLIVIGLLVTISSSLCLATVPYPGNDCDSGVTRAKDTIDPYTGNLSFSSHDIAVAGAIGQRGLVWARCTTSRTSYKESFFGLGHNWAHNWQWEMVNAGKDIQGRAVVSARLPGGWVHRFTETSPGEWWPEPGARFRLTSEGDSFVIQHLDGGEVRFRRSQTALGAVFTLNELVDAVGNLTTLKWSDGLLVQVIEPAGRWLKIEYAQLSSPNAAETVKPYTVITSVTSSDNRRVAYHYEFPADADYPVLSSVAYPDGSRANYTYISQRSGTRLVLGKAVDPRADKEVRGRVFRYRTEVGAAAGQIFEIGIENGAAVLTSLSADSSGLRSYALKQDNGAVIYRTYNPGGNVSEEIDALGFSKKREYDISGRGFEISTVDALGKTTRFERDLNGQVVKRTAPDGTARTWKRDGKGRVLAETDELGQTKSMTRDEAGRITKLESPDGRVTEAIYNALGRPVSFKLPNGAETRIEYNDRGLSTKVIDALGSEIAQEYDEYDRVVSATDARGNKTRFERDVNGRVTKAIYADSTASSVVYDEFGQPVKTVDAAGSVRTFVYDSFGRRTSTFNSLGRETKFEYAPLGEGLFEKPVAITTPEGRTTLMTYDANGRVLARTVAAGTRLAATTRYAYDARGRQISVTNARNQTVQHFYDERGHRVKTMNALSNATTRTFDAAGRKLTETDAKGNTTQWTYDAEGRELSKTDAKGETICKTYNESGRLASLKDPKGNIYRFEYDLLGRQTAMVYPNGDRESATYDTAGNKLSFTTRAGIVQSFSYDNRNRETTSEWNDGSQRITKAYDAAGRMIAEDNGVSKIAYMFDELGRLVSETQDLSPVVTGGVSDPAVRSVRYTYTDDNQRETLIYPDDSFVKYTYNARGQLENILGNGVLPPIASYDYDLVGNATLMPRENATETIHEYDAENRVTSIVEATRRSPLSELEYTYDEVDNRTSTVRSLPGVQGQGKTKIDLYSYDQTYQVTSALYEQKLDRRNQLVGKPEKAEYFEYDAVGNRIAVTVNGDITRYSVNELNEYVQVGEFSPTYDRNGNLAGMKEWLYRYDALNRLVEATNGRMSAKFYYDAKNRCVARNYNGTITLNYYDNWNLIEERGVQGDQLARYVHGRKIDEIVVMVNRHGTFYPHRDVLGNVTMLTDTQGKLVERYSYSVAGQVTIFDANGTELPCSAVGNRWLYTGREWLKEVGLYDYRNRIYSAELGRFMQTDPIRFRAGDINIYRYVSNGYVRYTDPSGLDMFGPPAGSENVHTVGRDGTLIPEGSAIGVFIEQYVPAGWTFGQMHDALVAGLTNEGVPDFIANIPTMPLAYGAALAYELLDFATDVIEFGVDVACGLLDAIGDALSSVWDWLFGE